MNSKRVLSIQSHVVHGYVGNKSATFPLQILGFEVDCINSVQFSNHTGYKIFKGQILNDNDLEDLYDALEKNDLIQKYSHLLTGYIGSVTFLKKIIEIIKKMKSKNPNLLYVCDPVMGDNGKMYVPKDLLPIYRDEVIPLADIVTPNQYEMELLCDKKILNIKDVWEHVNWFHERNVNTVVLSSADFGNFDEILSFLSSKSNNIKSTIKISKQGNGISFTGTGDLFAALYLAYSFENPNIIDAFEKTINTLQVVIQKTLESMPNEVKSGKRNIQPQDKELKIIQCKREIECPKGSIKAETLMK
ncbi:pyridoxal kinase [Condylostylus longicornis]|uniref:pyridoxal kinase n=1 Tax=Condylostylus longicornis TaxID=2530218 RepID=UPI00244E5657|nr:pyridoxal kinase [Condylostylus longicornis]